MRRLFLCLVLLLASACSGTGPEGPDLEIILAQKPAQTLSAYGLFVDAGAREPAPGVVSYELINPLFSDYSTKDRYVFVPDGQAANWRDEDVFSFPVGSVLVKTFSYAETGKIETRLLIHKNSGWTAYPYVWNADGSEATYAPIGDKKPVKVSDSRGEAVAFTYSVPNQNQCKTCHQEGDSITPIGPKARNLGAEQVAAWEADGRLVGAPSLYDVVPSIMADEGDVNSRARAYLDINCAHCHKADGAASNSGLWLTWEENDSIKQGIGKHPTAAGRGSGHLTRVIEPGSPETSILAYRMASMEAGVAMPELGRTQIDDEGVALVNAWIAQMSAPERASD